MSISGNIRAGAAYVEVTAQRLGSARFRKSVETWA